ARVGLRLGVALLGVGLVAGAARGAVLGRLVGAVGATVDVTAGDVGRSVGVLVALGLRSGQLGGPCLLPVDLSLTRAAGTQRRARARVLRLVVALVGV